jgi:hypothetical protein
MTSCGPITMSSGGAAVGAPAELTNSRMAIFQRRPLPGCARTTPSRTISRSSTTGEGCIPPSATAPLRSTHRAPHRSNCCMINSRNRPRSLIQPSPPSYFFYCQSRSFRSMSGPRNARLAQPAGDLRRPCAADGRRCAGNGGPWRRRSLAASDFRPRLCRDSSCALARARARR